MPDSTDKTPDNWSGPQVTALCTAAMLITGGWIWAAWVAARHDAWPGFAVALAASTTLALVAVVIHVRVVRRLDRNAYQVADLRRVTAGLANDTLSRLEALAQVVREQEETAEDLAAMRAVIEQGPGGNGRSRAVLPLNRTS